MKTIAEMSDKAKKDPNSATIGSSGEGSAGHVLGVWLGQLLNASFTHVPFQGGGPANIAMLGGTVSYRIDALSETTEFHKTGKARLLAVTGAKRDPQVPDVPTLKELGVESVILTNAAGGINRDYKPGDLVLISDHINLLGQNPLSGPNDTALGPRFPDMSEAYNKTFRATAKDVGAAMGLTLVEGIYVAVPGPSYETPAEIRYMRTIGADLVGMSTVPETLAANHMGMRVLGISCVTNHAAGVIDQKLNHTEVLEVGERMKSTLIGLLRELCRKL